MSAAAQDDGGADAGARQASAAGEPQTPAGEPGGRTRDAAVLLPLIGLFLLMPPMVDVFAAPHRVGGIPLIVVYLLGVWVALVLGAALLARALR